MSTASITISHVSRPGNETEPVSQHRILRIAPTCRLVLLVLLASVPLIPTPARAETAPLGICAVTFRVTQAVGSVGALQFDVNYASSGGVFEGSGAQVACGSLVAGSLAAFNDHDATATLSAGLIAVGGFDAPADVVRCTFDQLSPAPPLSTDFILSIIDASDPDGSPTSVTMTIDVSCEPVVQTPTPTPTSTPFDTCAVTFRVTNDVVIGSLQFDVNYASSGGIFEGTGPQVACTSLIPGTLSAFNDHDATAVLTAGLISLTGFDAPADVVRCTFDQLSAIPPVPADFVVTVTDASDPEFNSIPVEMSVDVSCEGVVETPTPTPTIPTATPTTPTPTAQTPTPPRKTSTATPTPTVIATPCPTGAAAFSRNAEDYQFLLERRAIIKGGTVVGGNIGVNAPGGALNLGRGALLDLGTVAVADRVALRANAQVFDVITNTLSFDPLQAIITGTVTQPVPLPVFFSEPLVVPDPFDPANFPPAFPIDCGGPARFGAIGEGFVLPPGSYSIVVVGQGGKLTLQAGRYQFCQLRAARSAIEFTGPATINVRDAFTLGNDSRAEPVAGLSPQAVQINLMGTRPVRVGQNGIFRARLFAPNALLRLGSRAFVTGHFVADELRSDPGFKAPKCGDGVLECGETCDPPGEPAVSGGNLCRRDCTFCGDGIVQPGEECDDGNRADGDACHNNCMLNPACRVTVTVTTPEIPSPGDDFFGAQALLRYPSDAVSIPGSGADPSVAARVTFLMSGGTGTVRDEDPAADGTDDLLRAAFMSTEPIVSGPFFTASFNCVLGAPTPPPSAFHCNELFTDAMGFHSMSVCTVSVSGP